VQEFVEGEQMTKQRAAYVFLFTDWHLQSENCGSKPDEWKPFARNNPAKVQTVREMIGATNQRFDENFGSEYADREKVRLLTFDVGIDGLDRESELKWEKVWAVLLDREALSSNKDKLKLLGSNVKEAMKDRENTQVYLFIMPKGDNDLPESIKPYASNFVDYKLDGPDEFISAAFVLLKDSAAKYPKPVRDFIELGY
jgi:hypothetical protein